jgi:plastocyanin
MAHRVQHHAQVLLIAIATAACGGSGSNAPPTDPGPGGSVTIITITASGTNPQNPTVALGTRIRWVNNDTRTHEMSSDPHPEHNICPEINGGAVPPGQQRETSNLVTARTCGYHDHLFPDTSSLKGTITIQ